MDDDTKPMGDKLSGSLKAKWKSEHKFDYACHELLNLVLTNKLYKHATASPKQFVILLPEEMKLRTVVSKKEEEVLKKQTDGTAKFVSPTLLDPTENHYILFKKIKALWNTWAFVSIGDTSWFSYDDSRKMCDLFEDFIFRRVDDHRPSLVWSMKAYLKTMSVFLDQININGKSLHDMVEHSYKWENIWTSWHPPATVEAQARTMNAEVEGGTHTTLKLDPKIQQAMLDTHKMAAQTQRLISKGKGSGKVKPFMDVGKGPLKGKGAIKEKGKGKGKGKAKNNWPSQWFTQKPIDGGKWGKQPWQKKKPFSKGAPSTQNRRAWD